MNDGYGCFLTQRMWPPLPFLRQIRRGGPQTRQLQWWQRHVMEGGVPASEALLLIKDTLKNNLLTLAGITAILQNIMSELNGRNKGLIQHRAKSRKIINVLYYSIKKYLKHLEENYCHTSVFPIWEDKSIFLPLAAFREYLLVDTLKFALENAKNPTKLFVGAVFQNFLVSNSRIVTSAPQENPVSPVPKSWVVSMDASVQHGLV